VKKHPVPFMGWFELQVSLTLHCIPNSTHAQ